MLARVRAGMVRAPDMPKVTLQPVDLTAEIAAGESLLDAGERAGVEMVAGCFNCSCGTCVVEVLSGMQGLTAPSTQEQDVLRGAGLDPAKYRLACSTRVLKGEITIRQLD
jgi:ferredoxin